MNIEGLQTLIEANWESRNKLASGSTESLCNAVEAVLQSLDTGALRIAEKTAEGWQVHEWIKKAILLSFRLNDSVPMGGGFDKVPLKFAGWTAKDFATGGFRAVPGAIVRRGAFVAPGAVLMPCFVNIGAHIGAGTMIDSWATVGSCAQIGAQCHISSGVVIGGVLEPLQAAPVIVEDHCFIGANSSVTEGVIVGQGAVIASGVQLGATTRIVDRASGAVTYGSVPAGAVIVPGMVPGQGGVALAAAIIVKRVDAATRAKTAVNDLLRD